MLNIESRFEVPSIVQALQRPLMVRQTSDIASKYVGETERRGIGFTR